MKLHTLYSMGQAASAARANVSGCTHDKQCGSAQVPALERTHLPDSLNNEPNGQGIACGKDRTLPLGELIEIAFDENGTETTKAYDLRACLDGTCRRPAYACNVITQVGVLETVRRDKGVYIESTRFRAGDGCNFDVT